jgi:hypothetical protein
MEILREKNGNLRSEKHNKRNHQYSRPERRKNIKD